MAIVGGLTIGTTKTEAKVAAVSSAITGTGSITSGLSSVDAGSAQLTVQNGATTIPTNVASGVSSITNGNPAVVVVALAAAANTISGVASNVGLLCTGS